jgi:xanthine dehydrogenase accessory factor
MLEIFQEIVRSLHKGEPLVLATVVRTRGSTPQKSGARLLIRKDGTTVGTMGGGCIESNIWCAAKEVLNQGEPAQYRQYHLSEELAAQDGLICGGTVDCLIEPVSHSNEYLTFAQEIIDAYQGGNSVVMATLIHPCQGSNARRGSTLFIRKDGATTGTLGEVDLDKDALRKGQNLIDSGTKEYVITERKAEYYIESFTTLPQLILCGGGHISQAIAPLAKGLEFQVTVIDDRIEFANKELFPQADVLIVKRPDEALNELSITPNTFIVVATRGHYYDHVALEASARSKARYVGLVGSRRKVILIYEYLIKQGISVNRIKEIHAPIGLDIHARTPQEIAHSIMAEILMGRLGGTGQMMKLDMWRIDRINQKIMESAFIAD